MALYQTTQGAAEMRRYYQAMLALEEDIYSAKIPLFCNQLGNPGVNMPLQLTDNNRFFVPVSHKLAITSITGFLAFNWAGSIQGGVTAVGEAAALGNQSFTPDEWRVLGMIIGKAMAATVELRHVRDGYQIFDYGQTRNREKLNLSTLLTGRPIDWSKRPHIVPPGETLEMVIKILDNTSSSVKGQTGALGPDGGRIVSTAVEQTGRGIEESSSPSGCEWGLVIHGHLIRAKEG